MNKTLKRSFRHWVAMKSIVMKIGFSNNKEYEFGNLFFNPSFSLIIMVIKIRDKKTKNYNFL